ncbi:MAG: hypothetical protein JSW58_06795 [Candidatus Latescibacterota bacterium]|nr:MAG: hypothetical protein JSW58_06795 [Candidatus Latescibacterota bacterium]
MKRLAVVILALVFLPTDLPGTTAPDLRSRIIIDGRATDVEEDEWVLNGETEFRETRGDSRWGRDNDISGIAVTWDNFNLYVVVPAVTVGSTLMLFIDTMCGGAESLIPQDFFRRNIEFGGLTPNFMLQTNRTMSEPIGGYLDCTRPFNLIENDRYRSRYLQDGADGGALEVAIPWEVLGDFVRTDDGVRVPSDDAILGVLAAITGGSSTGAGDAAPDPSFALENDSTRVAVLDNHIWIPLDTDRDGTLDIGVSPRDVASFAIPPSAQDTEIRQGLPIKIPLDQKLFSPDEGGVALFPVSLDPPTYTLPINLTARIYSAAGHLVRTLIEEEPMMLSAEPVRIEWDWRDDRGDEVPGGIYVLAVSGGAGKAALKNTVKASFAIIR